MKTTTSRHIEPVKLFEGCTIMGRGSVPESAFQEGAPDFGDVLSIRLDNLAGRPGDQIRSLATPFSWRIHFWRRGNATTATRL